MSYTIEHYRASADFLRARLGSFVPKVAMILGSGLGYLGDQVENPIAVDYKDIPNFKASTAPGHKGRLVFGTLEGQKVAVMQGRMHHYEGYSYEEVSYAVRVLRLLGCDTLVVTNAAGCVRQDWHAGELMLITDQIKMFSESPLRGENLPEFGVRFPDASHLYTPRLRELARETAAELDIPLREGVYFYCYGPQYETPAEIRAARILGGDAVGMSTAPEVIMAGHCGMEVLGLTLLSNIAAGILDQPITPEGAYELAKRSRGTPRVANRFLKRIRDFATVLGDGIIDRDVALMGLKRMDVDALGLDELDRSMLRAIIEMYNGGPVGLETLAAALGEESVTLEDLCEPYLMQMGFLTRTPRGRCATRLAYEHLGLKAPESGSAEDNGQQSLF